MVKQLSSMRFAFWVLISLVAWLIFGALLTINDVVYYAVKDMSKMLILDWVIQKGTDNLVVLLWFIGICIIGVLLAISFLFCTWTNIYKAMKNKTTFKTIMLFVIHILFVLIMGMHLASMLLGFKYSNVELMPGDTFKFENGYSITLNKVDYVDDASILKLPYKKMREYQTVDKFDYKNNKAELTLQKDGKELTTGNVAMLSPLEYKSIRATLTSFYLSKDSDSLTPGVNLVIMKNNLIFMFFSLYILEIVSILLFAAVTWKKE